MTLMKDKIENHPDCDPCFKCIHMIGTEVRTVVKGTYKLPKCRLTIFKDCVILIQGKCDGFERKE